MNIPHGIRAALKIPYVTECPLEQRLINASEDRIESLIAEDVYDQIEEKLG